MNLSLVHASEAKQMIIESMKAGLTCMLHGSPGIGKSSIIKEIGKEYNLEVIDLRLSTCDITDLNGLPNFDSKGNAYFAPFNVFPIESTPIPKGMNGYILFLDEFNGASKAVQLAAYKLVLDRQVGQYNLHPNCFIVCAGNNDDDNAITTELSTAMQSRLVHINMTVSVDEWIKNVAVPQEYDSRIIAYIQSYPSDLMKFNPEHNEQTFPCPRTWEFVNKIIKGSETLSTAQTELILGCVGISSGSQFNTFIDVFKDIPSYKEIVKNPNEAILPEHLNKKWAIICMLMDKINTKDLKEVCTYIDRFETSYKVLFYRSLLIKKPELKTHPDIIKHLVEIAKYVFGDSD